MKHFQRISFLFDARPRAKTFVIVLLFFAALTSAPRAYCQINTPTVGSRIPDFQLTDVANFSLKTVTPENMKGRWYALHFWSPYCFVCVREFPSINIIQNKLKNDLSWIMVGQVSKLNPNTREFYHKVQSRDKLDLPYTFDAIVYEKWGVYGIPTIIIVDPNGIVRVITNGSDLDLDKMQRLIKGESVAFAKSKSESPQFNPDLNQSGLIVRSLLTPNRGERQSIPYPLASARNVPFEKKKLGYTLSALNAQMLYLIAFVGTPGWLTVDSLYTKVYPFPILEMKDSVAFKFDFSTQKGIYNYQLNLPPDQMTTHGIMAAMQQDLERAFGYSAALEERMVPVYRLVAGPRAATLLAAKGGRESISPGSLMFGFEARNIPKKNLSYYLTFYLPTKEGATPCLEDMEDVPEFIDLQITGDLSTMDGVNKAIKKYDLSIIKTTAPMKAIVVRDKLLK